MPEFLQEKRNVFQSCESDFQSYVKQSNEKCARNNTFAWMWMAASTRKCVQVPREVRYMTDLL